MRIQKKLLVTAAIAATVLSYSAVSSAQGKKIGFSMVTQQSPFYVQLRQGAESEAHKRGDTLVFVDANGDVTKQNNDIQDLLTRKVGVLIINPVNPDAVAPSLAAAKRSHVPVVAVDRNVRGKVASYVGRDNVKMANMSAEALIKALKAKGITSGNIVEIQGDAGGTVMAERHKGFQDAVKGTNFKVIEGPYSDYIRANAVAAMQDILQAHSNIVAVFAHNDDMGMGALQVLKEAGKNNVLVAGVDGLSEALDAIANGNQYVATALNDPRYMGRLTVKTAEKAANGQALPTFINAGTELVTKQNVAEIKRDGPFGQYVPASANQPNGKDSVSK
ncbi:substrate-binding domain-containing protein [Salinisphaera sp. SWV1]|uniref:substrate-binding domain-containing protein n=1 Tax=Salinisphaera sp. SWV1 TaxID=3454139 RepID=UPI003F8744DE